MDLVKQKERRISILSIRLYLCCSCAFDVKLSENRYHDLDPVFFHESREWYGRALIMIEISVRNEKIRNAFVRINRQHN